MQISASVETALIAWTQVAPVVGFLPGVRKIEHSPIQYGQWDSDGEYEFRPICRVVTFLTRGLKVDVTVVGYEVKSLWTTWFVHQVRTESPDGVRVFVYDHPLGMSPGISGYPNRYDLVDDQTGQFPYREKRMEEFLF